MSRELVLEGEALGLDAPLREREEHERIVGVGAVSDGDRARESDHRADLIRAAGSRGLERVRATAGGAPGARAAHDARPIAQ